MRADSRDGEESRWWSPVKYDARGKISHATRRNHPVTPSCPLPWTRDRALAIRADRPPPEATAMRAVGCGLAIVVWRCVPGAFGSGPARCFFISVKVASQVTPITTFALASQGGAYDHVSFDSSDVLVRHSAVGCRRAGAHGAESHPLHVDRSRRSRGSDHDARSRRVDQRR